MGLRLLGTMENDSNGRSVRVYKDSEYEEHRVKFYIHGDYQTEGDYHCPDFQDAAQTAIHWINI